MKVNGSKTQLLCIHSSIANNVSSYINVNNSTIESTDNLKLLGFNFNKDPTACFHVSKLIDKFYGKLWTLRFLKKHGMQEKDLLHIYKQIILPSVEFSSVVYHSLITKQLSDKLEAVQRRAIRIILGYDVDLDALLRSSYYQTLEERRRSNCLKFAIKAAASPRFGRVWFQETVQTDRNIRATTREKYVQKYCRTDRERNSPIQYFTRLLNEHYGTLASEQTNETKTVITRA